MGSQNESGLCWQICLHTWFSVCGTVCEDTLGGVVLSEVYHQEEVFKRLVPFSAFCMVVSQDVSYCSSFMPSCLLTAMMALDFNFQKL